MGDYKHGLDNPEPKEAGEIGWAASENTAGESHTLPAEGAEGCGPYVPEEADAPTFTEEPVEEPPPAPAVKPPYLQAKPVPPQEVSAEATE